MTIKLKVHDSDPQVLSGMIPTIPDDYFPEAKELGAVATFTCPVCGSKSMFIVPKEHADVFESTLKGMSSDDDMADAIVTLMGHVDQNMGYLTQEERLHILTGVCSMECELKWVDTLWMDNL